jgi:hypothetical protein
MNCPEVAKDISPWLRGMVPVRKDLPRVTIPQKTLPLLSARREGQG